MGLEVGTGVAMGLEVGTGVALGLVVLVVVGAHSRSTLMCTLFSHVHVRVRVRARARASPCHGCGYSRCRRGFGCGPGGYYRSVALDYFVSLCDHSSYCFVRALGGDCCARGRGSGCACARRGHGFGCACTYVSGFGFCAGGGGVCFGFYFCLYACACGHSCVGHSCPMRNCHRSSTRSSYVMRSIGSCCDGSPSWGWTSAVP